MWLNFLFAYFAVGLGVILISQFWGEDPPLPWEEIKDNLEGENVPVWKLIVLFLTIGLAALLFWPIFMSGWFGWKNPLDLLFSDRSAKKPVKQSQSEQFLTGDEKKNLFQEQLAIRISDDFEAIKEKQILSNDEIAALNNTREFLSTKQILTFSGLSEIKIALEKLWDNVNSLGQDVVITQEKHNEAYKKLQTIRVYYAQTRSAQWSFRLSPEFVKSMTKTDKKLQGRILDAITKLVESPVTAMGNTIKPLTNDLRGFWRYRIGDYRLIYSPHETEKEIVLISFSSRGSVYS